ncbi:MAG: hypothetical protein RL204_126 [Bacteroidota bacterium]|jgi:hypothetical protein
MQIEKRIITLLLLIIGIDSVGQSQQGLDSTLCSKFTQLAYEKLENDSIYIPHKLIHLSPTATKILELDYGFNEADYLKGDVIPNETICFDQVMINKISEKYGVDFLSKVINEADSLDKLNIGYRPAMLRNYSSVEECFFKNFTMSDYLRINKDKLIVVTFEIDSSEKLVNLAIFEGSYSTLLISEMSQNALRDEVIRVMGNANDWRAARIRNSNISEKIVVVISHLNFL